MASEAGVAAALEIKVLGLGVPFCEGLLAEGWYVVRTVDGVVGERVLAACGALGVVLAPLSELAWRARGVVSWLSLLVWRCDSDLGVPSWLVFSFDLGLGLLVDAARLRVVLLDGVCEAGSAMGGPSAARLLL